jgi:hypothetical protein
MFLAMEPQCQRTAVGSAGFQACPNLCHFALFKKAGQLSKTFDVVSKAKAHFVVICSQLGLHSGFGDIEASSQATQQRAD